MVVVKQFKYKWQDDCIANKVWGMKNGCVKRVLVDKWQEMVSSDSITVLGVSIQLKWLGLTMTVLQNTFLVLAMRYSRVHPPDDGVMYLSSTAVPTAEFVKLVISFVLFLGEHQGGNALGYLWSEIYNIDSLKLAVPGVLYSVQNNLLFVALSNLEPAPYQILYQIKILTTALCSWLMLGKKLSRNQMFALLLLMFGVALVQLANSETGDKKLEGNNQLLGLTCVLLACCSSGFTGVYTEKILKHGRSVPLNVRNIQLSFFSIFIGGFGAFSKDFEAIRTNGFFRGYTGVVWMVVLAQAGGGLMIAVVMKYADNILKGFATSISIILSSYLSAVLFGFQMSTQFVFGASLVIGAVFLYGMKAPRIQKMTSSRSGRLKV
uniref:UDP-galactose transporter n=1 Tax=Mucochytrium quahogii TaxID=96639 RepID=A0A7S2WBS3_9STRA|mmetsp:Transcript_5709/g.8874  ORF Transcript_5709/g.8874 Transcript_5709/m.8874 type:complete len:378 (+) Transcript_5709:123-1256(+)|eukprot:CAMPEP_0203756628 /NCGR_PEP_ID=MMETSP0098-20131031/9871_1 /ASSEMBLY_ACC=CAM_ASM_000208 /TAXON_ID=96639 /ORGANISM=" , Strain NY0313808BC1" /LENGTH=377 /DNA_ID=CAMNT_0050648575 /DNA_START=93 /DNA_END=1226 /DNA_ORIENTATION=-